MAQKNTGTNIGFKPTASQTLTAGGGKSNGGNYASLIAPKAVSQARKDIKDWNQALKMTTLEENPRWYKIQQLFDNIYLDAHLKSQYKNRTLKGLSVKGVLRKPNGDIDEEQTKLVNNSIWAKEINRHINDSEHRAYSLVELSFNEKKELVVDSIPRENLDPRDGVLYPDYTEDKKIYYRDASEYGTWLLEFYEKGNDGLFNSAIPHVLMKRFAQSCHSELCEIYGIPPRVLKTNTQDPTMMRRGEKMMRDFGAAAWFIIDESEQMEWAKAATTSGDVYTNLIKTCKEEISLLFNGAVIGQDTKHGNRSKEESSQDMLEVLIESDLDLRAKYWNTIVIPALVNIGVLKGELSYGYEQSEDIDQLYEMTKGFLQSGKNVDDKWIEEKFGIKVTGDKATLQTQKMGLDFFD